MTGILLRYAPFAAAALLLAVGVHILTVLTLPALAVRTAGQLVALRTEGPGPALFPRSGPDAMVTPFADPAMLAVACRFDLADGPLRIRAQMGDAFSSLVVLSASGAVVHGLSDKAATRRLLDVVLVTEQQLRALESQDPEDRVPQEIRLRMPIAQGVAVVRSLAARRSDAPAVAEGLRRTQCATLAEP